MAEGGIFEGLAGEGEAETAEGAAAPSSADIFAAVLAMDQVDKDGRVAADASAFLRSQKQLVDLQIKHFDHERDLATEAARLKVWTERLKAAIQGGTALIALLIIAGLGWAVAAASRSHSVYVEAFHASPALAARGLDGEVVAQSVLDGLTHIQHAVRTERTLRPLAEAWANDVKIEVPEAGISIGELERLLREHFGHDAHISGDLVQEPDGRLTLTVRADDLEARSFTAPADRLPGLSRQAAEYVLGAVDPFDFAYFLLQADRRQDALAFLKAERPPGDPRERAAYFDIYAETLNTLGRPGEGMAKTRAALLTNPADWGGWSDLLGELRGQGREEEAWRALAKRQAVIDSTPKTPPTRRDLMTGWPLTQDWPAFMVSVAESAAYAGGQGSSAASAPALFVRGYTEMHDWAAAERRLTTALSDDRSVAYVAAMMDLRRALDAGRPEQALEPAARAQAAAFGVTRSSFPENRCWIGLALDLAGQTEKARATYADNPGIVACAAFQADGMEHRGDHAGADLAYARAVALAPDLPFAYQRWGLALLDRGDVTGAKAKFEAAARRGPHWADPQKGLGDVALRQGRRRDALVAYKRAVKNAPGWAELLQAKGKAAGKA